MLIGVNDKSLVDGHVATRLGPSILSAGGSVLQPRSATIIIACAFQFSYFLVRPSRHGSRLATMRDGLMTGLAFVANEGVKLDANRAKAKLLFSSTIRTNRVGFQFSKALYFLFSSRSHDDSVPNLLEADRLNDWMNELETTNDRETQRGTQPQKQNDEWSTRQFATA